MTRSRKLAAVLGLALAPTVAVMAPTSAETPTVSITEAGRAEISRAEAAAAGRTEKVSRTEFLESQARQGNPVDAANLRSAVVDGATVLWERGVEVTRVRTARSGDVAEPVTEFSTESGPAAVAPVEASGTGLGVEGVTNRSGGSPNGGYCTTTIVSEQNLTQCFERFRVVYDGDANAWTYFYNRWASAKGEASTPDWKPRKIDIRSRPWDGKRNDFKVLKNYWPKATQNTCSTSSFSVGIKDFSVTVPVWNCEGVEPIFDATSITAGAEWSGGAVFDQRTEGVDFAMHFTTWNDKAAPMADYGYAKFCKWTDATCEGVLRKDGW